MSHRFTRTAALGLAVAALAAPAASAQSADLRSPDSRDAARPAAAQDLRSPDARDVVSGRGTFSAPTVAVVEVPVLRAPQPLASSDGIDWGDAGVGAGIAAAGLALLVLGGGIRARRQATATG